MRDIIALYIIRYGIWDTLTNIVEGIIKATEEHQELPMEGKRRLIDTATEIAVVRNRYGRE